MKKECTTKLLCAVHQDKGTNGLLQLCELKALTGAAVKDKKKLRHFQLGSASFLWTPQAEVKVPKKLPEDMRPLMESLAWDVTGVLSEDHRAGDFGDWVSLQYHLTSMRPQYLPRLNGKMWELHIGFDNQFQPEWFHFWQVPTELELRQSIKGLKSIDIDVVPVRAKVLGRDWRDPINDYYERKAA